MQSYVGNVSEFQLTPEGQQTVRITCPDKAIPAPGQYVSAHSPADADAVLATVLFSIERSSGSFLAAPSIPPTWQLGTTLHLQGPFGKGFRVPTSVRNLALVPLGNSITRLLPLLTNTENPAIFTSSPLHLFSSAAFLPPALEINPLEDLPAALRWADFLAIELPIERLTELPHILGLTNERYLPCPAQALVITPMPCHGLADCGVCAVTNRKTYQLACKDGPVFEVNQLLSNA